MIYNPDRNQRHILLVDEINRQRGRPCGYRAGNAAARAWTVTCGRVCGRLRGRLRGRIGGPTVPQRSAKAVHKEAWPLGTRASIDRRNRSRFAPHARAVAARMGASSGTATAKTSRTARGAAPTPTTCRAPRAAELSARCAAARRSRRASARGSSLATDSVASCVVATSRVRSRSGTCSRSRTASAIRSQRRCCGRTRTWACGAASAISASATTASRSGYVSPC